MTNGDLVGWFLDFEFLETDELARFDLHYEKTLSLISLTLVRWTFDLRVEFSGVNYLINFTSADITGVHSHIQARLHISCSSYNTLDSYKATNLV